MDIRTAIASVITDQPKREAVQALIEAGRRIAIGAIYQKEIRRTLRPAFFGLSEEDLALDCIAELFATDDGGRFPQFIHYFGSIPWLDMDDPGVEIAFRRLVIGKLNEGLFRRYHEADPTLAKLVRNVKIAAKTTPGLSLVQRPHAVIVVGEGAASSNTMPLAPEEILEAYLVARLHTCRGLPEAVAMLIPFAVAHPHYRNAYPVVGLARVLRTAHARIGLVQREEDFEDVIPRDDVLHAITLATREVHDAMQTTYVSSGKIDPLTFTQYFRAIGDILASQYLSGAPFVSSYFASLEHHLPGLDREVYRARHRNVFEYLTLLCRKGMLLYLSDVPVGERTLPTSESERPSPEDSREQKTPPSVPQEFLRPSATGNQNGTRMAR